MITFTRCAFMAKQACATFSQVVQKITPPIANNFLKFFFALFAMLALGVGNAWGEDVTFNFKTIAQTSGTTGGISWETGKTGSATNTACNSTNGLVLYGVTSGGGYFQTTSPTSGAITNVSITSSAKKNTPKYTIYGSTDGSTWTSIESGITAGTKDHTITGAYTYFKIANTTAATAQLAITTLTITYETAGGETPGEGGNDPEEPGTDDDCVWQLVTSASNLKVGDEIVIAAKDYNYALSTTQNNNNRGKANITKNQDQTITFGDDVQIITLEEGVSYSGTYVFYAGTGYLYAAGANSNNYLRTSNQKIANGDWEIEITNGTAIVTAQGSASRNILKYNNSGIFSCYASDNSMQDIVLYKKVCAVAQTYSVKKGTLENCKLKFSKTEDNFTNDELTGLVEKDYVYFTITPSSGYELKGEPVVKDASDNNVECVEEDGVWMFEMPASDVTVSVSCVLTVKTYKVTFNANGHGTAPTAQNVEENKKATEPTVPSATGYTFGGWYTDQACSDDKKFDFNTPITEDITLYAKWTAETYTITLDANGGKFVKDGNESETIEIQYVYGTYANYDQAKLISDYLAEEGIKLSREGYQLNEMWQSNGSAWKRVFTAKDRTIQAQWSKLHTVTFNTGTNNPTIDAIKGTSETGITLPAGPDPLCPDWTFAGWAEAIVTETTTEPKLFAEGTNYKPTGDCTLYAVYSKTEENGGGTDYQLVTSEPTDWSGTYLIVNTEDAKVWKGSATSDNGAIDVTITSNTIKSDETTDKEIFTIAPMTGGYSIKGASGKYISGTSDKNETNYGTSAALNTISIDEDNNVKITSNTSVLRQNNTSRNLFRYYKSSSYSTQHPIQLYKKGAGNSITTFSSNPDCTPPAEYTITWWANGEEFYTQTDVEGTTIEVPTTSPKAATYACDDKVFVGWLENEIDEATDEEPTFITDFDKITENKDFFAVFATEENNDELIFTVGKSGDFKIYAVVDGENKYATAFDSDRLGSTNEENSAVTYTFTHKGDNQYTIYNGSKYIAYGTTGTNLKTQNEEYLWNIAPATNGKGSWRITSVSTTSRAIIYRTGYDFKAYGTNNITNTGYYDIEIGSVPTTTYSGYVTTCEKPTYTRDVTPYEYGTICLPYGSSDYTGAEFYEVSFVEYGKGLWLDQLAAGTALAAGKPYIFRATAEKLAVVYKGEKKDSPIDGENGLTGTFTDIAANTDLVGHYIIAKNQIWVANDKNTLPAYRAYINAEDVPTTAQAQLPGRRRVCMGENAATGLDNITNGENNTIKVIENGQLIIIRNGEKYNIHGQKL